MAAPTYPARAGGNGSHRATAGGPCDPPRAGGGEPFWVLGTFFVGVVVLNEPSPSHSKCFVRRTLMPLKTVINLPVPREAVMTLYDLDQRHKRVMSFYPDLHGICD